MKSLPFIFLFARLCASAVVPSDRSAATAALHIRADDPMEGISPPQQHVSNPDNEEPYTHEVTKAVTQKPGILSMISPTTTYTNNRWFDWDQSCTDDDDRKKILLAFEYGYEYAQRASGFLQDLLDHLPKPTGTSTANKENIKYIVDNDPAFTQMFYAQDHRIKKVKGAFDKLLAKMKSYQGRNEDRPDADGVRFVCDREGVVKNSEGYSWCGTGDGAAQAVTKNAYPRGGIEPKYDFEHSATIVFCPVFFDDEKFPNADKIAYDDNNPKTLDTVDSRERIMIHEWLHLEFTEDFSGDVDEIGFEKAAKIAGKYQGSNRKADWQIGGKNCDNYAWYALYAYWNNNGGSCQRDAWPSDVRKPNRPK